MKNTRDWLLIALASITFPGSGMDRAAAQDEIVELISNGDFETGDLSNWTISGENAQGCQTNWNASSFGGVSATNCQPRYSGTAPGAPNEGNFAAYNSFDGAGPIIFGLSQRFTVPESVTSAVLAWDETYNIDYNLGDAPTLPRRFVVGIFDEPGTTLIQSVFSEEFFEVGGVFEQDWTRKTIDLTSLLVANAGTSLTLSFQNVIPENFTGPGGFGLDAVSIEVFTIPEPTSTVVLSFALATVVTRRRRATKARANAS